MGAGLASLRERRADRAWSGLQAVEARLTPQVGTAGLIFPPGRYRSHAGALAGTCTHARDAQSADLAVPAVGIVVAQCAARCADPVARPPKANHHRGRAEACRAAFHIRNTAAPISDLAGESPLTVHGHARKGIKNARSSAKPLVQASARSCAVVGDLSGLHRRHDSVWTVEGPDSDVG